MQLTPFPKYPALHTQLGTLSVIVHIALGPHGAIGVTTALPPGTMQL